MGIRFGFHFFALMLAAQDSERFEREVRPILATRCHSCHGEKAAFAGLRLDSREAMLKGGDSGPVLVPGQPSASKLVAALQGRGMKRMPPTAPLPAQEIAILERWIEDGAVWPAQARAATPGGFDLEQRRRAHWAWEPVKTATPQAHKLRTSAPAASPLVLLRRATFDLTGLPPTLEEISAFEKNPNAEELVDRLLASPRFGERMARRWMDIIRYSESHGSEGDPDTPYAWRYRDYLIRAFNRDVPYDQLIREHLAGDLLANPRYDAEQGVNESLLGLSHLRMVEHGFQPVDPWEDRVKWTDNQIDVFSKAFQGLTISCARCHDHKFDAIAQKDYYALFGVFAGARPTQIAIDTPERLQRNAEELRDLKPRIRQALAEIWKREADSWQAKPELGSDPASPLHPLSLDAVRYAAWLREARAEQQARREFNSKNFSTQWILPRDLGTWPRQGAGVQAAEAGEFSIAVEGDAAIHGIYPPGVYSHLLSDKHGAVITSPRFRIETDSLSLRMLGGNFSYAQLIIENYSVPRGGIYNLRTSGKKDELGWFRWDLTFWKGFTGYLEFSTFDEATHAIPDDQDNKAKRKLPEVRNGRSWFGANRIVFHNNALTPKEDLTPLTLVLADAPENVEGYRRHLSAKLAAAVEAWSRSVMTEQQAALLDYFVRHDVLTNRASQIPAIAEYRRLEQEIPVPRRAPGILEEAPGDHPLLVRGDHKRRGDPVPRAYLRALGGHPFQEPARMRLELAEAVASPANPLTARVMVNRLWQYCFRTGLVSTPDNFGKLGAAPADRELLDWLASEFVADGWSIKKMLRRLMLSPLYQREELPVRRLEAEEIRDAILASSGQLDLTMYGESVPVYYAHETGATKGDRPKGPLDGAGRRSVYLEVRRNATNPFLEVFDVYKPATTRGQRDVTNVPGQSLALLNSPFVVEQSGKWASRLGDSADRIETMYLRALGRRPTAQELDRAQTFLGSASAAQLGQALWNLKEFLYVR